MLKKYKKLKRELYKLKQSLKVLPPPPLSVLNEGSFIILKNQGKNYILKYCFKIKRQTNIFQISVGKNTYIKIKYNWHKIG